MHVTCEDCMANFNFNKVTIGGKITRTPVLYKTISGMNATAFNVVIGKSGTCTESVFVRVAAWGQTAEFIVRHFREGNSICIVGSLSSRFWIDKHGERQQRTQIHAQEVFFVDAFSMQLSLEEKNAG